VQSYYKAVTFDQLESVEEERRQGVTMDERGAGLMLVSPRPLDRIGLDGLAAIVTQAGEQARWRFLELFTANIQAVDGYVHWQGDERALPAIQWLLPLCETAEEVGRGHRRWQHPRA
jgi:hypothetical protein